MNWLAHIFLSEQKIDFQIGNFIADPYKARPWENASEELIKGMNTHKLIDSYSDSHEMFKQSKKRLKEKGLLKSIIVDLTYDYLLTRNWQHFCHTPLDEFIENFYEDAYKRSFNLPTRANAIILNLIDKELLRFETIEDLELSFRRLDMRLSPKLAQRDNALSYLNIVEENIKGLEKDFMVFFPQLCNKTKENLDTNHIKHWKI